ncbi:hypothetical protein BCR33DRAFT_713753 [Rhizoclosmatium globosum]|uniref:GRAM domain-containing protein n=1 Tax=Rhizoclosmatium globosum TaxID=329046 RepID=A0A1Y2CR31_9FUNG|nr:hypothetical protein BCR33DRAFT_713753 [Rhizoclosmatium globosum]|eukprot:ORY49423.1 hypothetical protein BCR33DRAFT_713753 [Rhizoclosmatium globosum]
MAAIHSPPPSPSQLQRRLSSRIKFGLLKRDSGGSVDSSGDDVRVLRTQSFSCALRTGFWLDQGVLKLCEKSGLSSLKPQIVSVERAKYLYVNTSLIILTKKREYFFASFLSRDGCLAMLKGMLEMRGIEVKDRAIQVKPSILPDTSAICESPLEVDSAATIPRLQPKTEPIPRKAQTLPRPQPSQKQSVASDLTSSSQSNISVQKSASVQSTVMDRVGKLGKMEYRLLLAVVVMFVAVNVMMVGMAVYTMLKLSKLVGELSIDIPAT